MKPKLPSPLLEELCSSGQPPPWKCKLHLRRGRTVFAVEITEEGEIANVGGRAIYSTSDISFSPEAVEDVTIS